MGIGITQEQLALAESVRGWLARAVPPEAVRKLLDAPGDGTGRPGYWEGAVEQGILGPHLAEEHGGGGGTTLDLTVVTEETGRAALPGPYLPSVLASAVLARAGRGDLAGALAGGERIGAVALGPGTLTATETPDGYRLDGTAPPVLGGGQADLLVLDTGTAWLAVDADRLTVRVHESADPTRPSAEVSAHGVTVPRDRVLEIDAGLVQDLACVLYAAEACGTAAWALHTAAEYAKVREQFGRPIGQFQAVKHLCADMLVRVEQARALTWDAARAVDETEEVRGLAAALAASVALDAAYSCAKDCIQVLGGIGFTWEHDAHLYLRRALVARQLLGPGDSHRLRAVRLAAGGARRELRLELPHGGRDVPGSGPRCGRERTRARPRRRTQGTRTHRVRRTASAEAVRTWRGSGPAARRAGGVADRRGAGERSRDRDVGGALAHRVRDARAAGALPRADPAWRSALVSAVLRAGRRIGPGESADPG